ncbi:MAG: signal recognition particle-docking protein FtsY [Thaumarchaeota archaeon]|nr:MAG: signal recognition particle-docking protein FtsY [Nitrososphaerota archaeon]
MFEKLRQAFTAVAKAARERKISGRELDELLSEFEISLIESDVAQQVAEELIQEVKKKLSGASIERSDDPALFVKESIRGVLEEVFAKAGSVDLFRRIEEKKSSGEPFVILFLGINGSGKTTTVAKLASILKERGISVVSAAGDTHRPGAIEQLTEHAERLGMKVVSQRYGADAAAVGRDGYLYAKAHHVEVLLIDTAGRMQTNQNLMEEMAKIVRVVTPDFKVFVADSLTGNDAVSQAELFSKYTGFDGVILTKADADAKGGAGLSIVYSTQKPILFLGMGQGYKDLKPFDRQSFIDSLLEN